MTAATAGSSDEFAAVVVVSTNGTVVVEAMELPDDADVLLTSAASSLSELHPAAVNETAITTATNRRILISALPV